MFDEHRAIVTSTGPGIVGRWPSVVLVSSDPTLNPTLDPAAAPTLDDLQTATGPLAAVVDRDGVATAIVRGEAELAVDGTTMAAATPQSIGDPTMITLSVGSHPRLDPPPAGLDLRAGTVPGTALTLASAPTSTPSFEVVDLRTPDAETRAPLPRRAPVAADPRPPQRPGTAGAEPSPEPAPPSAPAPAAESSDAGIDEVLGIRCSRGHFNNPLTAYCQACGISMVHLTHQLVPGPRPTLGFMVFNDGATYALDRSYLLGRTPAVTADDGLVSPLVVTDAEGSVSGRHARIELVDWDVSVRDLGSTNGTYVWNTAGHQWDRVGDQPVSLSPGAIVAVGRTTFVFESAVRRR